MIANVIRDSGLSYATSNGDTVYICSAEPTNITEATSTYALGKKTGVTIGSPTAGTVSGRKVVVPSITGGSITGTNTATHFAVTVEDTELLAVGPLDSTVAVTSGNTFSLTAVEIEIPA